MPLSHQADDVCYWLPAGSVEQQDDLQFSQFARFLACLKYYYLLCRVSIYMQFYDRIILDYSINIQTNQTRPNCNVNGMNVMKIMENCLLCRCWGTTRLTMAFKCNRASSGAEKCRQAADCSTHSLQGPPLPSKLIDHS